MIDWPKIAKERGFVWGELENGDPKAMLCALYKEHKSIEGIANELMISRHTVRLAFERYQIEVKTQGGAQYVKFDVTEDLLDEIEATGVTAVARRLGVDYTSVYKRTKDARRKRREQREDSEQPSAEPQDEKGTPPHGEDQ
jgi:DNA invertase Pin-like site-specific DNA recombinase